MIKFFKRATTDRTLPPVIMYLSTIFHQYESSRFSVDFKIPVGLAPENKRSGGGGGGAHPLKRSKNQSSTEITQIMNDTTP